MALLEARQHPALLKRVGVNLLDGMLQGTMLPDGSFRDSDFEGNQERYLHQMSTAGLAVDCLLGINPPRWMISATPQPGPARLWQRLQLCD